MTTAVHIVRKMSDKAFIEMINASSRKVRDILFSKLAIKSQTKKSPLESIKERQEKRSLLLHQKLREAKTKQEAEVCQELLRNWLMTKRPMLKQALDFLEVPNDNGLVDRELDFFKQLSKEKAVALQSYLEKTFNPEEVEIYLRFVEAPLG